MNQGKYLENATQCGKRKRKRDVAKHLQPQPFVIDKVSIFAFTCRITFPVSEIKKPSSNKLFHYISNSHLSDKYVLTLTMTETRKQIKSCLNPILRSLKFLRFFGGLPLKIKFKEDQTKECCHIRFQLSIANAYPALRYPVYQGF